MPRSMPWLALAVLAFALQSARPVAAQDVGQGNLIAPALVRVERLQRGEQPIRLQSAQLEVAASGSLARTTLLLTLHNPNDRVLEGTLQVPLHGGQQVTGFALDVGGVLRDAVPVPKDKGQQVFESIERRGVDPGLLEQVAGNQFRLRVYPLPPRGTRQVKLVLDEAMPGEGDAWRLGLPVQLLGSVDTFGLRVHATHSAPAVSGSFDALAFKRRNGGYETQVPRRSFRADAPLALRFPKAAAPQAYVAAFKGERYVLAEIPLPSLAPRARQIPGSVGLLWDASASARRRDRGSEFALLDRYFRGMGNGRVRLRLLRDVGEDGGMFEVRDGDWHALRARIEAAAYDGATNLADWSPASDVREYLLVSDGLHNYGDAMPALKPGQRLYALSSAGAHADAVRLAALADASGGRLVAWHGRGGLDQAQRALLEEGARIVGVAGEGVRDLQAQSLHADGGPLRVAGRLTDPDAVLRVTVATNGRTRVIEVPVAATAPQAAQAAQLWASWRVAALSAQPELHRAAIARLGQEFGLVTPGTSLLVLEDPADYVRYGIPPPEALRAEVERLEQAHRREQLESRRERLDRVADLFAERIAWWERRFPKDTPPRPENDKEMAAAAAEAYERREVAATARMAPPPPTPASLAADAATAPSELDRVEVTGSRIREATVRQPAPEPPSAVIRLEPWQPDSPYARRLRAAPAAKVYALYLDERDSHAHSTAFYLDVADLLFERGRRAEGLRVLSNLAELDLENRHVLRVLGYRLMQAEAWPLAVRVFRQVRELADEEPQSHRDLGLALAAAGRRQDALAHLYEVVTRPWDGRFAEVELVALNELNAILATSPEPLDSRFIDPRLLRNLPLDLRVVLGWDSDNSDMDLWVTDPNGEKCYYSNRLTYQGGLISDDFTGGYGPEEFVLRDARPGRYKVEANFYGDRQQIVTGATSLTLTLSTGWGTPRQQDRKVTLRLSGAAETVLVGEFEVR